MSGCVSFVIGFVREKPKTVLLGKLYESQYCSYFVMLPGTVWITSNSCHTVKDKLKVI